MPLPVQNPNKKTITMIVAGLGKPGQKKGEEGDSPKLKSPDAPVDASSAKTSAMSSFKRALDRGDSSGMADALQTFYELCKSEEEGEEANPNESVEEYED